MWWSYCYLSISSNLPDRLGSWGPGFLCTHQPERLLNLATKVRFQDPSALASLSKLITNAAAQASHLTCWIRNDFNNISKWFACTASTWLNICSAVDIITRSGSFLFSNYVPQWVLSSLCLHLTLSTPGFNNVWLYTPVLVVLGTWTRTFTYSSWSAPPFHTRTGVSNRLRRLASCHGAEQMSTHGRGPWPH